MSSDLCIAIDEELTYLSSIAGHDDDRGDGAVLIHDGRGGKRYGNLLIGLLDQPRLLTLKRVAICDRFPDACSDAGERVNEEPFDGEPLELRARVFCQLFAGWVHIDDLAVEIEHE